MRAALGPRDRHAVVAVAHEVQVARSGRRRSAACPGRAAAPRRSAASGHARGRRWGGSSRSKSLERSTVPTIESSGIDLQPEAALADPARAPRRPPRTAGSRRSPRARPAAARSAARAPARAARGRSPSARRRRESRCPSPRACAGERLMVLNVARSRALASFRRRRAAPTAARPRARGACGR